MIGPGKPGGRGRGGGKTGIGGKGLVIPLSRD